MTLSRSIAAEGRVGSNSMERIGVGVVGCGFVGLGAHVSSFRKIDGSQLVAVADPNENRRNKAAAKYEPKSVYADYADLVNDPEVDLVVVAAPTPMHAKVATAAIEAGKHVLCEMPLAANLQEADQIIAAAQQKGVVLMPSLTFRFTPNYVKAKEMIRGGDFGTPTALLYREFISAADLATQWPASSWMWNMEASGGPLFTLSVWSIDMFRWLLDAEITEVHGAANYTVLDQYGGTLGYDGSVTLKFDTGAVGCLQYSGTVTAASSTSALEVIGSSGRVAKATGNETLTLYGDSPRTTDWYLKEPGSRQWGHYQQNEYFTQCLLEGRTPEITPEDGRKAMEVALKIARVGG
jgi:predicted dehydrogenase